jgi:hypothetical protein
MLSSSIFCQVTGCGAAQHNGPAPDPPKHARYSPASAPAPGGAGGDDSEVLRFSFLCRRRSSFSADFWRFSTSRRRFSNVF